MLCSVPEIVVSDVIVTNSRGAHARVIAEHTFAMLLAFTRGLHRFEQDKAARRWSREAAIPDVLEISGWTIGIVGYGQVGQQVAQRARGFEMEILAVDENPMPDGIVDQTRARQMIKSRFGTPDDIAAMGALLLSDDGSFITAQTISVDGGVTFRP